MLDRVLADAVVVFHLGFIVFVLAGGILVITWRRRVAWLHLPAVAWAAYAEFTSTICPLTPLENTLRRRAGQSGYKGGFIENYLIPIVYPSELTPNVQVVIGAIIVAANVALYAIVVRRSRQRGRMPHPTPD